MPGRMAQERWHASSGYDYGLARQALAALYRAVGYRVCPSVVGDGFCMNALLLDEPGSLRPGVWPDEESERGRLRLRVQAVSVCGSDLHYYKEGGIGAAVAESPFVLGHEFSAVVNDERGEEFGMPPGTLVAVDPAGHCASSTMLDPKSSIRCQRALMTWMELYSSPSVSRCTP